MFLRHQATDINERLMRVRIKDRDVADLGGTRRSQLIFTKGMMNITRINILI